MEITSTAEKISATHRLSPPTCDDRSIWSAWLGVYSFPTLAVADEIGLFPLLKKEPLTAGQVSEKMSLGPRATEAMLGVLASIGFLMKRDEKFHTTPESENYLLPDSPYYCGGIIRLLRDMPFTYTALKGALLRDKPVVYGGRDLWKAHEMDPAQAELFTEAMQSISFPAAVSIAANGKFDGVQRVLDVAGGSGCYDIALALRYPDMRFTIMELPAICDITKKYVKRFSLEDRIDVLPANMFLDPWPKGYDAVFFSNIFHDWDLDSCMELVKKSYNALPRDGKIYLNEALLDDTKAGPPLITLYSMDMIYFTLGKQFTARELTDLLTAGGFEDVSITNPFSVYSLVCARKS
ncbi:MAG TPA: methyltransferase [Nitrososphaerales archaeon]|nr:methyltransferase [Nitrososphaerales archaeon]